MKNWLIILALLSTNSVSAAKTPEWIGMGTFQDEQVYVNVNSQSRQGDIASVFVKLGAGLNMISPFGDLIEFDCKRNTVLLWSGDPKMLNDQTLIRRIADKTCKRSWQIWK